MYPLSLCLFLSLSCLKQPVVRMGHTTVAHVGHSLEIEFTRHDRPA